MTEDGRPEEALWIPGRKSGCLGPGVSDGGDRCSTDELTTAATAAMTLSAGDLYRGGSLIADACQGLGIGDTFQSVSLLNVEVLMIVVTGAGGQLGRGVVEKLLTRLPADRIVASVRDPAKAGALAERGVHIRAGDFGEPDQLAAAFTGAEQVLVVSVDKVGETALGLHRAAIQAARAAGSEARALHQPHGERGTIHFSPRRSITPQRRGSSRKEARRSLRFGTVFTPRARCISSGKGSKRGEIRAPEDGPVSWTTRADLAEADAILLAEEGRLDGITPPLTAPEAFTMTDLAAIASELTGRRIKRVIVSDDEWRSGKVAQGAPAPMVDMLLGMYRAARRGDFAAVDPTLEALLGRRPQTMRDVLSAVLKPAAVRLGEHF